MEWSEVILHEHSDIGRYEAHFWMAKRMKLF